MEADVMRFILVLPSLLIIGGVVVVWAGIRYATRQAELEHQERMAMIERGITPPEIRHGAERKRRKSHGVKMSLGILLCGLGMGLLMLISFAADAPSTGIGIGGAVVMLGLAFVVSAIFTERQGPSIEERAMARQAPIGGAPPPATPGDAPLTDGDAPRS
jgi:uncharacterized membrane protein